MGQSPCNVMLGLDKPAACSCGHDDLKAALQELDADMGESI